MRHNPLFLVASGYTVTTLFNLTKRIEVRNDIPIGLLVLTKRQRCPTKKGGPEQFCAGPKRSKNKEEEKHFERDLILHQLETHRLDNCQKNTGDLPPTGVKCLSYASNLHEHLLRFLPDCSMLRRMVNLLCAGTVSA